MPRESFLAMYARCNIRDELHVLSCISLSSTLLGVCTSLIGAPGANCPAKNPHLPHKHKTPIPLGEPINRVLKIATGSDYTHLLETFCKITQEYTGAVTLRILVHLLSHGVLKRRAASRVP